MICSYTVGIIMSCTMLMGCTIGALGTFSFVRRHSLLGDAMSHAALPGIALMFLITHTRNQNILLIGGMISSLIGALLVSHLIAHTKLHRTTVLGIVLSSFFGLGLLISTLIQKIPTAQQSLLNKFLFGNAATLLYEDLIAIIFVSVIALLFFLLLFKEALLMSVDWHLASLQRFHPQRVDMILTLVTVMALIIGLQTVGVVLMSSMLIAPAAAARQWTTRLASMTLISGIIGGTCAGVGSFISYITSLPTGPVIIVVSSSVVIMSLLMGHLFKK